MQPLPLPLRNNLAGKTAFYGVALFLLLMSPQSLPKARRHLPLPQGLNP